MKTGNLTALIAVSMLFTLTIIGSFTLSRTVSAQKDNKIPNLTNQTKPTKFSNKANKSKKHIPDRVAYELFLRTVGEYNAKGLVERAGLNENQVEIIVSEAKSLNDSLNDNDEAASRVKENKNNLSATDVKTELARIESKRKENIDRTVDRFLPGSLNADGMSKLKEFIDSEVKDNIQTIPKPEFPKEKKGDIAYVKTSTKSSFSTSGGTLYLYSAAWQNGMDIFGSGTLSEEYTSETSYKVNVTVTSPSGRSNTTEGDWDYALVSHDTGLSIGVEDGTYQVQANFEQAEGYYDEYKNFFMTGSINVGSLYGSFEVPPQVSLVNVTVSQNPIGRSQTANALATVNYTDSIPDGTKVSMELADSIVSPTPHPTYTIGVPTNIGGAGSSIMVNNGNNRTVTLTAPLRTNPPQNRSQQVSFPITTSQTTNEGTVNLRIYIGSLNVPPPVPSPAPIIVPPLFRDTTLTITATTPTPTPTPTPGGGGGGGGGNPTGNCFCANGSLMSPEDGCGYGGGVCPQGSSGSNGICCWYSSPIVLDIDGDGYDMTSYANGVQFDVSGRGWTTQTSWTSANSDEAWLVLDRNQSGRIESGLELFGDACEQVAEPNQRNGFSALSLFDAPENGGNGDGKITRRDRVFRKLRLWQDRNHNGISEPEEMSRLPALDVVALFLDYQESRRTDQYGNRFKYRAKVRDKNGARVGRWAWDVFLVISPPNN